MKNPERKSENNYHRPDKINYFGCVRCICVGRGADLWLLAKNGDAVENAEKNNDFCDL